MKQKRKRVKNPRIRSDGCAKDVVYSLDIDCIRANASQPRKDFDIESIIKLADSIRRYGILQPLTVRRVPKEEESKRRGEHRKKNLVADVLAVVSESETGNAPAEETRTDIWDGIYVSRETELSPIQLRIPDAVPLIGSSFEDLRLAAAENGNICVENGNFAPKTTGTEGSSPQSGSVFVPTDTCQYELIAGERRLRAARMLGLREVPCIIVDANDALSAELALVENMLRENLNMFEQAEAFAHLSAHYSLTQEEIASRMSLSQSAVANKIRLLKLSADERELIMESGLTERHARAFLRVSDTSLRESIIRTVVERRLNVSDTDKYITAVLEKLAQPASEDPPAEVLRPSPDKLCANIYKFINRMQTASGNYLIVNRRSDEKSVVITLTVRKGS